MSIKILSANCQGIGSLEKRLDVLNYLKDRKCDIFCLQDCNMYVVYLFLYFVYLVSADPDIGDIDGK